MPLTRERAGSQKVFVPFLVSLGFCGPGCLQARHESPSRASWRRGEARRGQGGPKCATHGDPGVEEAASAGPGPAGSKGDGTRKDP